MKLNLRVFFFNAKTDYLPYYKNFKINIADDEPLKNILPKIKEQNIFFNYPQENLSFRVNSLVTDGRVKVKDVVKELGKELLIEPTSSYHASNCLILNDDDFYESYKLLEEFCNEDDKIFYQSLHAEHYASATFEYNKKYIGDAVIILASRLIYNKNPHREEILKAISCPNGLWDAEFEDNMLIPQDYSGTFNLLRDLSIPPKDKNRVSDLGTRYYKEQDLSNLEEVGVAFYYGNRFAKERYELSNEVKEKGYFEVKFNHSHKSCGINIADFNEELALIKAGRVLSDAYDSGAVILVANKDYINYFKRNYGKIEKVINRELRINLVDIDNFSV
jgi:succinate dehydrogenase/fumarate reductase-like Fe-S protein